MAHFAELNDSNIVQRVIAIGNADCLDGDGNESEAVGIAFCKNLFGDSSIWKQTSYNKNIRANYAGIGYTYDSTNNVFISPKPFNSWSLNSEYIWTAPVAYPDDGNLYVWDESSRGWVST